MHSFGLMKNVSERMNLFVERKLKQLIKLQMSARQQINLQVKSTTQPNVFALAKVNVFISIQRDCSSCWQSLNE